MYKKCHFLLNLTLLTLNPIVFLRPKVTRKIISLLLFWIARRGGLRQPLKSRSVLALLSFQKH
jgi:hypothetical protein